MLGPPWLTRLASVLIVFGLVGAPSALAQLPPPSCEDSPACVELTNQAALQVSQNHLDEALAAYEQAYQRWQDSKLIYNLARVAHRQGRFSAAAAIYERFLNAATGRFTELRRKAEEYKNEAYAQAASEQRAQAAAERSPATALDPLPDPSTATPSAGERKPLIRKGLFWAVIGVAVAGAALGIGLGVASQQWIPDQANRIRPF